MTTFAAVVGRSYRRLRPVGGGSECFCGDIGWGFRLQPLRGQRRLRRLRADLGDNAFYIWPRGESVRLGYRYERCGRRIRRAPILCRDRNPTLRSFTTACSAADAPGASGDRARHHIRDDDADDAELAVLSALVDKINAWCLRRGSAQGRNPSSGSASKPRRSGARVRVGSIISSAADLLPGLALRDERSSGRATIGGYSCGRCCRLFALDWRG